MTAIRILVAGLMTVLMSPASHAVEFTTKAVKGNRQVCTGAASECMVMVRVSPTKNAAGVLIGCVAGIDMAKITVKGDTPVTFFLAKVEMDDSAKYEFRGLGIVWRRNPQNPDEPTDPLLLPAYVKRSFGDPIVTVTKTVVTVAAAPRDEPGPFHAYEPNVRDVTNNRNCDPGDPKINNDGG